MANINRDYLIVLDAKSSVISEADELKYYITDEHSQNLFVNLVVRDIERINKYVEVHDPEKYELELHIVKPNNDIVRPPLQASLLNVEDAIYAFELPKEAVDYIGTYKCELRVTYKETDETTITTSNKFKYKVKRSIYNDLDSIQEAPQYPVVIQLFDKLSDINQYEEDRRANELARQLAEQQRQTRFNALDADMTDSIEAIDNKVVEVEDRITTKEQAVDKLIVDTKADIDNYKEAKDQEIDDYKTAKDIEINNAIAAQDNKINTAITTQNDTITQAIANQDTKIDTAITAQNDKIEAVQNNDSVQNNKLDTLQNKATIHEERITATEVKNTEQDNRLDIIENTNTQQNSRLTTIEDKNVEQDNRLNTIEAIDVAQNTRLDAIEAKNTEQDDRLLDIEKVNKRQDMNLKCLFAESKNNMIDVTEEGNSIYLQNSTTGYTLIDEIKGNTLVNCNKEPDKELILNGNINTSGDNTVTLTEGVDGGLVDVALEGNTLVNVSKTKDSTALPLDEELTYLYANTQYTIQFNSDKAITADITLGGTQLLAQSIVKGLNRISITTPETLVDNKLVISGVGANISEVVVTDTSREFGYFEGMKSVGECEELAITSANSDNSSSNTQQLTHEPLRAVGYVKDRYVLIDGKWYIERNCGEKVLVGSESESYVTLDDNFDNVKWFGFTLNNKIDNSRRKSICDKFINSDLWADVELLQDGGNNSVWHSNTFIAVAKSKLPSADVEGFKQWLSKNPTKIVYFLQTPAYEQINYNPLEVYSGTTHITTNSAIPTNITVKNHGFNCLLKPSTTYTISSNLGLNTVTTPSVLTEDCLRFMDTDTSDVTTMRDVLVLEGDWTTKADLIPANFSGMESAFEQEYDAEKGKYKVNVKVANEDKSKENNITFYINEPLRGVGNVKDRVYVKDDKVVVQRNCYELKVNRNCTIILGNNIDNYSTFMVRLPLHAFGNDLPNASQEFVYCNTIPYIGTNIWGGDKENVVIADLYAQILDFRVNKNKLSSLDIEGFYKWLENNPTTVVYPLAEPTYEEVEYNDTKLFIESFKNSTLSYNSNVPVTSKLYYSYSVPIVDTVAALSAQADKQEATYISILDEEVNK